MKTAAARLAIISEHEWRFDAVADEEIESVSL